MQERVREGFLGLLGKGEEESNDMFLVDAGTSIEEVEGKIWEEVRGVVGSVEGGGWMGLGVVGEWGKDG
jgi:thymidylate kinase